MDREQYADQRPHFEDKAEDERTQTSLDDSDADLVEPADARPGRHPVTDQPGQGPSDRTVGLSDYPPDTA